MTAKELRAQVSRTLDTADVLESACMVAESRALRETAAKLAALANKLDECVPKD